MGRGSEEIDQLGWGEFRVGSGWGGCTLRRERDARSRWGQPQEAV